MSGIVSWFLLMIAGVVFANLQVGSGFLVILVHNILKKAPKKQAFRSAWSFLVGNIIAITFIFAVLYLIFSRFSDLVQNVIIAFLSAFALMFAILYWFKYYQGGRKDTKLWLSRSLVSLIEEGGAIYGKSKKERQKVSFWYGVLATLCELPFSIFLIVSAVVGIYYLPIEHQIWGLFYFLIMSILPLIVITWLFHKEMKMPAIQKLRIKNKIIFKSLGAVGYLMIGLIILMFGKGF